MRRHSLLSAMIILAMCAALGFMITASVCAASIGGEKTAARVVQADLIQDTDLAGTSEAANAIGSVIAGKEPAGGYAADLKSATHGDGSPIRAQDLNGIRSKSDVNTFLTPETTGYTTYEYDISMPKAGTLEILYAGATDSGVYVSVKGNGASYVASETLDDGVKCNYFNVPSSGTVTLEISVSGSSSEPNQAVFSATYAPSGSKVIPRGKVYQHGNKASNKSTFKVKAPSSGYFKLALADGTGFSYSVKMKTKGFSQYQYLTSTENVCWIGVKKGTYTIQVETYAPVYLVKVGFSKVKESKYGSKRSSAKQIGKNKTIRGLMITKGQKTHWYKFRNPKNQKVTLVINSKLSDTGKLGGIKVYTYSKKDKNVSTIYSGNRTTKISLYNFNNGGKLLKGTYYIQISPYQKGTGSYTLKWK